MSEVGAEQIDQVHIQEIHAEDFNVPCIKTIIKYFDLAIESISTDPEKLPATESYVNSIRTEVKKYYDGLEEIVGHHIKNCLYHEISSCSVLSTSQSKLLKEINLELSNIQNFIEFSEEVPQVSFLNYLSKVDSNVINLISIRLDRDRNYITYEDVKNFYRDKIVEFRNILKNDKRKLEMYFSNLETRLFANQSAKETFNLIVAAEKRALDNGGENVTVFNISNQERDNIEDDFFSIDILNNYAFQEPLTASIAISELFRNAIKSIRSRANLFPNDNFPKIIISEICTTQISNNLVTVYILDHGFGLNNGSFSDAGIDSTGQGTDIIKSYAESHSLLDISNFINLFTESDQIPTAIKGAYSMTAFRVVPYQPSS